MSTEMADPATTAAGTPAKEVVDELKAAFERLGSIDAEIDEIGEPNVEAAADGYRNAMRLLDSYAESAIGTGDFGSYLEFQSQFLSLVDQLPDSAMAAEGFQRASDRMDKRRLSEKDFTYAREAIEPASEAVDLLERREKAAEAYRSARHDAKTKTKTLEAERKRLNRLQALGDVDLSVSVEPLREPIEAYNDALADAFETFRKTKPAHALFDLLDSAADRPLVGVDRPPRELAEYIDSAPAGDEPLSRLQEYAEYSPSKLDHYVEDPGALRTTVAVHQTYLDRLGPEPLSVGWPPAEAGVLRARLTELAPLVRRLDRAVVADEDAEMDAEDDHEQSESLESHRRRLARLTRRDRYDRLRDVAVARAELDDEEFELVASGAVESERNAIERAIEAIEFALAEYAVD